MASSTRASSFLPTIKCSTCSVEIPISLMGEHVCAPAPLPESRLKALDGPFAPSQISNPPPTSISTKARPPRLNPSSTFDSFLDSNPPKSPLRSPTIPSSSRSASPVIPINGRRSPFQAPSRSATSPLPAPIPSSDLSISQDCAFPPFPTSRSRAATPTTPSESSFPFSSRMKPPDHAPAQDTQTPIAQRDNGGSSVMQKMNNIARGPFTLSGKGHGRKQGHRKSPSMGDSQDFARPRSPESTESHYQRPSTSSSNYTRNPSVSSTAGSSRFTFERSKTDVPSVPAVPWQKEVAQQEESQALRTGHQPNDSGFDFGSFNGENRSQTFPKDGYQDTPSEEQANFHRRPSEPSIRSHRPRPSIAAAALQPLHEIGSTSSFKPSKSLRGRKAPLADTSTSTESAGSNGVRDGGSLRDTPPVPNTTNLSNITLGNPYHTPHESVSSNESSSSGAKTGSSRSSPPLNDSPLRLTAESSDHHRLNNMFDDFRFDVDRRPSFDDSPTIPENPSTGYLKPRPLKTPTSTHPTVPTLSPYDEAPQRHEPPLQSPEDYVASSSASQSDFLHLSPAPPAPPAPAGNSVPRPRTATKGNCRGCGEVIKGKSVSSADGRLTGRYHKQCFVCKTCRSPFQTADFYVMHNNPYCGRHYHELNGSLCKKCDRGIEGQYLETADKRLKFHPHCFSCQECHRILRDDYFEWNGRTLCEQHAFRAAQQPSSLGPGRRFPERRTTRLMMM